MAEFTYTGVDRTGQRVTGNIVAPSEGELRMILRSKGIRPTKVGKAATKASGTVGAVPVQLLMLFTRQLQLLVSSGVPLLQGLGILQEQSINASFKNILSDVKDRVAQGSYFWETLASYPQVFPKLYVALIRAGEASGSLDQMLKRLSRYLEDSEKTRRMVKGAMTYPAIVISVGVGVIALMLIFVIPKFEEMLKSSGQELPWFTQAVITASHFMVDNVVAISGGTFALVFLLMRYLKTEEGRAQYDRIMFRAPLFGPIMQKAGVARFCRTLQTLLMSGVNLIDAIDICRATIDNAVLEESVKRIRGDVESGKTLGMVVSKIDVFPKMAAQMIMVGESTGNLDKMLEKIADFFEQDVEILVGSIGKALEPLILVFLGTTVGGLMIAMYLPIFKLAGGTE